MSPTTAVEEGEGNLWASILEEAQSKSQTTGEGPSNKTGKSMVVLGDHGSGKRTLLAQMQKKDKAELSKGLGLEYTFLQLADKKDDLPRTLNIWNLAGDTENSELLDFCINKDNVSNTVLLIALDYSTPWSLMQSLTRWMGLFETKMQVLHKTMEKSKLQEMKTALERRLQRFSAQQALLAKEQGKKGEGEATEGQDTITTTPTPDDDGAGKKEGEGNVSASKQIDDADLLPLPDGVLTENYGVPILVVCCKCDAQRSLEKDYEFKDTHLDFIQQALRRYCMKYGAGLLFTSAKDDTHTHLALEYVESMLFSVPFNNKPEVLAKDSIFIPAGWDSPQKIAVVLDTLKASSVDPDTPFDTFIVEPKSRSSKRTTGKAAAPVKAEDEQEFLKKHLAHLEKSSKYSAPSKSGTSTFTSDSSSTRTSRKAGDKPSSTSGGGGKSGPGAGAAGGTQQGDLEAAKDFFDTLLKTGRSRGVGTPDDKVRSDARKAIANFKGDDDGKRKK